MNSSSMDSSGTIKPLQSESDSSSQPRKQIPSSTGFKTVLNQVATEGALAPEIRSTHQDQSSVNGQRPMGADPVVEPDKTLPPDIARRLTPIPGTHPIAADPEMRAAILKALAASPALTETSATAALARASGIAGSGPVGNAHQGQVDPHAGIDGAHAIGQLGLDGMAGAYPLLDQTLTRATVKGYVPVTERNAVKDRVLSLSTKHGFRPDDFALVTLIESDGMNPRATNGRCHGIIQFCEGDRSGAATVGFQGRAEAIRSLSVLQQLELVDRYFDEVGIEGRFGEADLSDLYLSVLMPAARDQVNPQAPLPIPRPQARVLHENEQTSGPITRDSIVQGLTKHGHAVLAREDNQQRGVSPTVNPIGPNPKN